jgi:alkylation response protein AidB-like acyl-CoA dehydrogenase
MIYVMHCGVTRNMLTAAHEPTKREFLPKAAAGEQLYCSARNEPNASATQGYVGKLRQSLEPRGDGSYLFNTTKFFASGSTGCDYISVMGRVTGDPPDGDELWVLVPRDDPGVEVIENWDTLGMRGTRSNYVRFTDVVVEPIQCFGEPGKDRFGDYAILGQCVAALAIAQSAFNFTVKFLRGEVGEERGIDFTQDVNVQRDLGEVELQLEAIRMMVHQACLSLDRTGPAKESVSGAVQRLWYWSRFAGTDVLTRVLQLVGGRGLYRRLPLERFVRDGESIILMGPSKSALATAVGKARLGDGPQFESLWLS